MNINYNDFIGIYDDVYPDGFCEHLIQEFERLKNSNVGSDRLTSENTPPHIKSDYQIFNYNLKNYQILDFNKFEPVEIFFNGLQECYNAYVSKFSILTVSGKIRSTDMKMQKTGPGEGYHIWHSEQGSKYPGRVLVFSLYLNDLNEEDGGETEFLFQKKRYQPKKNRMLLFPAAFTHTHRGNTVIGDVYKYIVTGWFYFD